MKIKNVLIVSVSVLLALVVLFGGGGCASKRYVPKDAVFDERFVGIWRGELQDEEAGKVRRWKKRRRADGTMMINIGLYDKEGVYLAREVLSGAWWVQENMYYEKIPSLEHLTVAHRFEFVDDSSLKFEVKTANEENKEAYSFTEKKVGDI